MADNTLINAPSIPGGQFIATKDVGGINHEKVINEFLDGGGNPIEVSATNPFPVTDAAVLIALAAIVAALPATPTTVFNGKTTVTSSGTRVALASSQVVRSVTIKAALANSGTIYVGNSTVAVANGFELAAGDTISLGISNLAAINLDASTASQSVTYIAVG